MEKAYKGVGGYKVWDEKDDKHKPTHHLLTNEEMDTLSDEISSLKSEKRSLEYKVASAISDGKEQLEKEQKRLNKKISDLEKELEKEQKLNINLLRVNRERANAYRKIQPKGVKSGFMILEMKESMVKENKTTEKRCYITTIETPYSIDIPISVLDPNVLNKDNFRTLFEVKMNDDHNESCNPPSDGSNFVFRRDWKTGKDGFWQLVVWHTYPFMSFNIGTLLPVSTEDLEYGGESTAGKSYYYDKRDKSDSRRPYDILADGKIRPWTKNSEGKWIGYND